MGQSAHSHMMMTRTIRIFKIGPGFQKKWTFIFTVSVLHLLENHIISGLLSGFGLTVSRKGYLLHENHEGVKYSSCFEVH